VQGELVFDMVSDDQGATISFSVGQDSVTTLQFSGLTEVPTGDINLSLTDPDTGEIYQAFVSDVISEANDESTDPTATDPTAPDEVDTVAIDPDDPDLPDAPGPDTPDDTMLDPVDPDAPDPPVADDITGPVLEPVDPDDELPAVAGDLALDDLILRDSNNVSGLGAALDALAPDNTEEITLGDENDVLVLPDDGVQGTGDGALTLSEGTPVLTSDDTVAVVDAGAGDDNVTAGDGAAFVFGGKGDDTLIAGEGAMALFGGLGEDSLDASEGDGGFLDGGTGNDTIVGGAGDDVLDGGEHGPDAGTGDDVLQAGAGDDLLRGGLGGDTLLGGTGNDVIDHLGRTEERETVEHREFAWHIDGEADLLEGGQGNDTVIFDGADSAHGGVGQDLFWLYSDGGVAEIADFRVGEDFLRVSLNPHIGENDEPDVAVELSENGEDGYVIVNGDLVAILRGAPDVTVSDIYAEVQPDVFPAG